MTKPENSTFRRSKEWAQISCATNLHWPANGIGRHLIAKFVFIGGAEGSGTTLLLRLLAASNCCVSLGGNYQKFPQTPGAKAAVRSFLEANANVWDRNLPFSDSEAARKLWQIEKTKLVDHPDFAGVTHFLFKRSSPFMQPRGQRTPDLWDVLTVLGAPIVIVLRDPCATTYSVVRREFETDLRRAAMMCSEQLTFLAAQVAAIGTAGCDVISYEQLSNDPLTLLPLLALRLGIPYGPILEFLNANPLDVSANARYREELTSNKRQWLEDYFHEHRRRQWYHLLYRTEEWGMSK